LADRILDALVVGAAVAGSRTSELIAKDGKDVLLIEDNTEVGKPCKCTGLVSWRIKEILPNLPSEIVMNTVGKAKFFSPMGSNFTLKSKNPVYLLSRPGLDKFLFESAKKAGVKTKTGERVQEIRQMKNYVKVKTDKRIYKAKMLVGADGANSTVGKQIGLEYPKEFVVGVQTTATGNFDDVELWFGSKICPNFFAWVAPENSETARIGLAANPNPSKYYQQFLMKRIGKVLAPDVGGIIRFGLMKETTANRTLVVGDAACQVKPYSGGGIIYGLIASNFAADAVLKSLEEKRFDQEFLKKNYDEKWKETLAKPIKRGMMLHNFLSSSDAILNSSFLFAKLGTKIFTKFDMDLINFFA